jgi:hypothetical protein
MAPAYHHFIDQIFGASLARVPFFSKGIGDMDAISRVVEMAFDATPPAPIEIEWTGAPIRRGGLVSYRGKFRSPAQHGLKLPKELETAYFELTAPIDVPFDTIERGDMPLCVYLAATTDQLYFARRFFSAPLVRRGILSLVLMSPFYGKRKPASQYEYVIETISDQLVMNMVTVDETRALLDWFRCRGFKYLGVSGYSLGGFGSAYTGALSEYPIAVIPCAMGAEPGTVYLDTIFHQVVDWDGVHASLPTDTMDETFERFREIFEVTSLDKLSPPHDPDCAIIVAAEHDLVIPLSLAQQLAGVWGSELRTFDAGHISGILRGAKTWRRAILDAFGTLMHKYP